MAKRIVKCPHFLTPLSVPLMLLMMICGAAKAASPAQDGLVAAPVHLQTQLRVNPVAINSRHPEFGWVLPWKGHGQMQSAYEILVASTPSLLSQNNGDIWNSGKVRTDQSINIPYGGPALHSRQRCFWKLRVWNQLGVVSQWSNMAQWQEGLLSAGRWHGAQWIGLPLQPSKAQALLHAQWIWYPEGQPTQSAPIGTRRFRRTFVIPGDVQLKNATVAMTADNSFVLRINGHMAMRGDDFNHIYMADVARFFHSGRNVIYVAADNTGTTANPAGLIGHFHLLFAGGRTINIDTDAHWDTCRGLPAHWKPAMALGPYGIAPWGRGADAYERSVPAQYLRRDFTLNKPIGRAIVYVCGLGWSRLFINGRPVSRDQLSPALSWYPRRCYYCAYNVTRLLHPGQNTVGVALGEGRFYAPRLHVPAPTVSFGAPRLLLQLHIRLADGSTQLVVSNHSWQATDRGPIVANNEYDGETYDARLRMTGWDQPGFNAAGWQSAITVAAPGGALRSQFAQPIRVTQILHPKKLVEVAPGKWIFDMGQNMAGWCQIMAPAAPAGTAIVLRYGESLTRNGKYTVNLNAADGDSLHLFVANLRSAKQTDTLILNGKGPTRWHPVFTTHGFRFVEMTGYPGTPTLATLEGQEVHNALPASGGFACSDKLVNQIVHNWRWSTQNNYRSIPSDCPQRDERQGWMGDRSQESLGETFAFNTERFYEMWLWDMQDGQQPDGSISDVNPPYWQFYSNNVTWPSTFIFVPANLYRQYGRLSVIRDHYAAEKKWMLLELGFVHHGITSMDSYGDWCSPARSPLHIHSRDPKRATPGPLLASITLYQDLKLMARYAGLLHKTADQQYWLNAAAKTKIGVNHSLWNPQKNYYGNGSDTSCILPLAAGIVPAARRADVIRRLLYRMDVVQHGYVGSGLIGGQWLFRALTRIGHAQTAWDMLNKTGYPSWGYMVAHGATTVWELWNGNTANPAMNSQDHVMLIGDMVAWLYEDVAGIKCTLRDPAFHHIIMRPLVLHGLTWVKAWHRSPYGKIVSDWKITSNNRFRWFVAIPTNSTATVEIPAATAQSVRLNGHKIISQPWIKFRAFKNGRAIYTIESGNYNFTADFTP